MKNIQVNHTFIACALQTRWAPVLVTGVPIVCSSTRAADPTVGTGAALDLVAQIVAMEDRSYAAWRAGDTSFWPAFLSEKFVGWGSSGRLDKRSAIGFLSGANCRITSYRLVSSQLTALTPAAVLLTHRTEVNGTCHGKPVAPASYTATIYVREDGQWKAGYRAQSAIVDPMKAIKPAGGERWTSGATRTDFFGDHIGNRADALKAWSGDGCDVKSFEFTGASATMFAPDFGVLTYRANYTGKCFGQDLWPIWATVFYVKHGDNWLWNSGINVLAGADAGRAATE